MRLQDALRNLGLEMNHSKTQVLQGADAEEEAKSVRHSAVETGLDSDPQDLGALEALIEELVAGPESASRTALSFVCRRLRDNNLTDQAESFLDVANRMPQGADVLARLFREAFTVESLVDWFLDYARSPWGTIEWAVAQFATIFPSDWATPEPRVVSFFQKQIQRSGVSLPMLAIAASRLASWSGSEPETRGVLRDCAESAADPLARRVLTLALAQAKEKGSVLKGLLGEFEDNGTTLALLEAKQFKVILVADIS